MASFTLPYQPLYQNQLQFNLGVPLTTQNLAAHFHHPPPILVERISGQHAIPSRVQPAKASQQREHNMSQGNYSVLSQDKMEMMSQLARRDLQNQQRKAQFANMESTSSSPVRAQRPSCSRLNRNPPNRNKQPLRSREAHKNRPLGSVQTPPPSRKPQSHSRMGDDSFFSSRNVSINMTKESDIQFPVKPSNLEGRDPPSDEISKLQQEMEDYLSVIENIAERAISEGHTNFLRPSEKGRARDGFLDQDEDENRVKMRMGEQNTRSARNLYNLRQKVKQLQRDVAHADLNKPAKKSQIILQVTSVHRGALKSLQTFVQHLPSQDLTSGLPSHYQELSLLLRQLIALSTLTQHDRKEGATRLLQLLEKVDTLSSKWRSGALLSQIIPNSGEKRPVVSKDWVSDTKVNKDFGPVKFKPSNVQANKKPFGLVSKKGLVQRGRTGRPASGKENKARVAEKERKDALRSGIASLLGQQKGQSVKVKPPQPSASGVAWEVDMRGPSTVPAHAKGYMLPSDLVAKRERAQRAVELSNQARIAQDSQHFAEPTISTNLKCVSPSRSRSSSAPASPKKEVNFDLDTQPSPKPWIPAGSSTRSPRSRSLSAEGRRAQSPFYVRNLDKEDIRDVYAGMFSQSQRESRRRDKEIPAYGFRSLPTDKKLRNHTDDSLLDILEEKLYDRLMMRRVATAQSPPRPKEQMLESNSALDVTEATDASLDEALDITDLDDSAVVTRKAASIMDAPTLENIKLRLAEMQREQREIRQRWSSFKFTDTKSRSRNLASSVAPPALPPAIKVTQLSRSEGTNARMNPVNKEWAEEPVLFTKPFPAANKIEYLHTVGPSGLRFEGPLVAAGFQQPKKLLTMKQTAVERIAAEKDRFENYLRKHSHHPTGKFDPWKLVEEISDEILNDCLQEVAGEVEQINEEIANQMYKSEFMVDQSQSQEPTEREKAAVTSDRDVYLPVRSVSDNQLPFETGGDSSAQAGGEYKGYGMKKSDDILSVVVEEKIGDYFGLSLGDVGGGGEAPLNMSANQNVGMEEAPLESVRSVNLSPALSQRTQSSRPSSQQMSPQHVSAAEPNLENVSQFLSRAEERSGSAGDRNGRSSDHRGEADERLNDEDEYDEEDEDSFEDDEDEYSEEDFEDVSDVGL